MQSKIGQTVLVVIIVIAIAVGGWFYWQHLNAPKNFSKTGNDSGSGQMGLPPPVSRTPPPGTWTGQPGNPQSTQEPPGLSTRPAGKAANTGLE